MCGRYTLHSVAEALGRRFSFNVSKIHLTPRYNICPTQDVLAVAAGPDGVRHAHSMRWGLIPFWETEFTTKLSTINAKLETAPTSRLYRDAFRRRRCLIPADGFYEWRPASSGKGAKTPFWIHRKDDAPFAFAGMYSVWRPKDDRDAEPLLSCTILTTEPNAIMAPVHNRMPVILRADQEPAWLDPELQDPDRVSAILRGSACDELELRQVRPLVNSPRNQGPELIIAAPEVGFTG